MTSVNHVVNMALPKHNTGNARMNSIETQVSDFLSANKIKFSVAARGETVRDDGDTGWKCDAWNVTIDAPRLSWTTEYFTGTGLRDKGTGRAKAPSAASVLHSLVLDGGAIDQSFDDWCDDYGYRNDSRKALATYSACCETGRKLRVLFTAEQRTFLADLLADF